MIVAATFALTAAPSRGAEPAPAAGAVKTSTSTPSMIYTAERLRDPFSPAAGSGGGSSSSGKPFTAEDFNIHNLSLRAIMKDSAADYALFSDTSFGVSFILRKGKLYDAKNKLVAGVTGAMSVKQKTARLITADGDVQIFRLGDEDGEEAQSD